MSRLVEELHNENTTAALWTAKDKIEPLIKLKQAELNLYVLDEEKVAEHFDLL